MVTIGNSGIAYDSTSGEKSHVTAFRGLSTDTKPTDAVENATFTELDTGKVYYFSGGAWNDFGADGSIVGLAIVGSAIVG